MLDRRRKLFLLALLGCAKACGDAGTGLDECGESVTLAVSSGTSPEFTWSPTCAVSGITVEDAASRPTWIVRNPDSRNTIGAPVVYGQSPPGTIRLAGVDPLRAGFPYRAVLFRTDRSTGQVLVEGVGETTFTP